MAVVALSLPELRIAILQYLDMTSLVAAAQINKVWAEDATNLIWRGQYCEWMYEGGYSSILRKLANESPERRNWYTKKIKHLYLGQEKDRPTVPKIPTALPFTPREFVFDIKPPISVLLKEEGFRFPNLKSLVMKPIDDSVHEEYVAQFLQSNLILINIFSGFYSSWFFDQIIKCAPSLRVLVLDNPVFYDSEIDSVKFSTADFLKFLQAMPSIEYLGLTNWHPVLEISVLRHIFTRRRLQTLHMGVRDVIFDMPLIEEIGTSQELLPDVVSLDITAEERAMSFVLLRLPKLEAINLALVKFTAFETVNMSKLFETLSRCAGLQEISVSYGYPDEDYPVYDEDIIDSSALLPIVNSCRQLRVFKVETSLSVILDDNLLETMASKLPGLEECIFMCPECPAVSHRSVVSFGKHCHSLRELYLPARVEITLLDRDPDIFQFPQLYELSLLQLTFLPMETIFQCLGIQESLIRLLETRFPRLSLLYNIDDFTTLDPSIWAVLYGYLEKRPTETRSQKASDRVIHSLVDG